MTIPASGAVPALDAAASTADGVGSGVRLTAAEVGAALPPRSRSTGPGRTTATSPSPKIKTTPIETRAISFRLF
ncbi:hypothetical protein Adu01nite_72180 [Paractinoplanes durhamensis]|uniref:Uncharacterized protein n=1 Tax=Paractinoplanes durhamensis TaxID=113563 RepID=A0ABQ3Z7Q3_9ACTN|nr:hypothetical protein Adu01nite_72180 [Actinoplanes durhamensis]